jgi:hypothetical protein
MDARRVNTGYLLRVPALDEIETTFGSLRRALDITGGDIPTLCFYLANPDRIADAPSVEYQPSRYADELRDLATHGAVVEAYLTAEKPTITAAAEAAGVGRWLARRHLVKAGLWSAQA